MKKKILLGIVALALLIGVGVYASTRPEPADTRFTGAYALADGTLVFVTPRDGKILRQTEFWPDPFEPADWRAQWVEKI